MPYIQRNETDAIYAVMVKMDDGEFIQAAPRLYLFKATAICKMNEMKNMPQYVGYEFKVMRQECIMIDYAAMCDGCNNELETHVMKFLQETCQKRKQVKRSYGNDDVVYYYIYTEVEEVER